MQQFIKLEKPEAEKYHHDTVGYENPSTHPGQQCRNCEHFIKGSDLIPNRCEGVRMPIADAAWCHRFEEIMAKKHKISHTHIEHHHDGSHTVTHHMDGGGTMSSAHGDLDGVHDKLQESLGQPNPGEAAADMGQHGVPAPMAAPAGLPMGQ
jgi:hypothetical protein